eukprot:13606120-Heterocapsa_arctica.AAC.1
MLGASLSRCLNFPGGRSIIFFVANDRGSRRCKIGTSVRGLLVANNGIVRTQKQTRNHKSTAKSRSITLIVTEFAQIFGDGFLGLFYATRRGVEI